MIINNKPIVIECVHYRCGQNKNFIEKSFTLDYMAYSIRISYDSVSLRQSNRWSGWTVILNGKWICHILLFIKSLFLFCIIKKRKRIFLLACLNELFFGGKKQGKSTRKSTNCASFRGYIFYLLRKDLFHNIKAV